jgi:hypothetical protein
VGYIIATLTGLVGLLIAGLGFQQWRHKNRAKKQILASAFSRARQSEKESQQNLDAFVAENREELRTRIRDRREEARRKAVGSTRPIADAFAELERMRRDSED